MKQLIMTLVALTVAAPALARIPCQRDAQHEVAKFTGERVSAWSVLGHFEKGSMVHLFLGDTGDDSIVYEVAMNLNDGCRAEGIVELEIFTTEFEESKMEQISRLLNN